MPSAAAGTRLAWNSDATAVTVYPSPAWATATFYTIAVGPAATDTAGVSLGGTTRSAFVTRAATTASLMATKQHGASTDVHIVVNPTPPPTVTLTSPSNGAQSDRPLLD